MVLVLAAVLLVWTCGALLAVSLCWAAGRGDERELAVAADLAAADRAAAERRDLVLA